MDEEIKQQIKDYLIVMFQEQLGYLFNEDSDRWRYCDFAFHFKTRDSELVHINYGPTYSSKPSNIVKSL